MFAILYGLIWLVLVGLGTPTSLGTHGLALLVTWSIYALGRASTYYTSLQHMPRGYEQFRESLDYESAVRIAPAFDRLLRTRVVSPPVPAVVQYLVLTMSVFPTVVAINILLEGFSWHFDHPPSAMNLAAFFCGPPILGWVLSAVIAHPQERR